MGAGHGTECDAMAIVHGTQMLACQNLCMSDHFICLPQTTETRSLCDAIKPVLLYTIIACMHIKIQAASKQVLRDLENFGAIIVQINLDIAAFNQYVEGKHAELHAHGMTDGAMVMHLLQGYNVAADKPFVAWIKHH